MPSPSSHTPTPAAISPNTSPNVVTKLDSSTTIATTRPRPIPTARIMPISRVRSNTAISSTFAIPNAIAMKTAA